MKIIEATSHRLLHGEMTLKNKLNIVSPERTYSYFDVISIYCLGRGHSVQILQDNKILETL